MGAIYLSPVDPAKINICRLQFYLCYTGQMQYFRLFSSFFFCLCVCSAQAEAKSVITIAADSWCPINCAPPEKKSGVGIDLAKAIFEPLGYEIDYQVMPWTDALAQVRAGKVDAVIGASIFDDSTLIFPRQAIYNISDDFYVLKGNSWHFQGVHTLKSKRIGVIADYGYGEVISDYVRKNQGNVSLIQVATGENALADNIKKLQNREIDAVVETRPVMEYTIAKMHLGDKIEWGGTSPQAKVYLAFSPALSRSKQLAAQFDAGIRKLILSATLDEFYSVYGLSSSDRE